MEDFSELDFEPVIDDLAKLDDYLHEKLGVRMATLTAPLETYVKDKAEELSLDIANIAPHGDYGKLLEDNESMTNFLREDASKPENWKLEMIRSEKAGQQSLLQFVFINDAIDDGTSFKGYVFINKSGKMAS